MNIKKGLIATLGGALLVAIAAVLAAGLGGVVALLHWVSGLL